MNNSMLIKLKKNLKSLSIYLPCIIFLLLVQTNISYAKLTDEQENKLKELEKVSGAAIPMFGKIEQPLKGSVSTLQNIPTTINLPLKLSEPSSDNTIKLDLKDNEKEDLSGLEDKRKSLQKAEEQGLNFIQPSLQLTTDEQKAIDDFFSRSEQEQLLNLWKATIERNKTIQFIVQKLTPADSPQAANSVLSKTIGAAIFLPFYALQAITNNAGAYYGSQVGGRVLGSVIEGKMNKNQTQLQLSQTETIILFMMVDEVAERLRQRYHDYKRLMVERTLATSELEEAKKDCLDASELKSPETEVLAHIQRRAIERDVRNIDAQMRFYKTSLAELAGPQAISELDEQLKIELAATQNTPLDFLGVEK